MAKAYEITVWKPHAGKRQDFMKNWREVAAIFKSAGVSNIEILEGAAGKDVGNIVIIQTFKGLADNGSVNENLGNNEAMKTWMEKHGNDDYATLISHDLYSEIL